MATAISRAEESELVFVVDDDRSVRRSLGRLLTTYGFRVTTFASAEEILASASIENAGCLIVDLRMPGIDGLGLQKQLADAGIAVPIVFLSGDGDVPSSVRAMKDGAVDFLTKPVESSQLIEVVGNALRNGEARRAQTAVDNSIRQRVALLTNREREVMHLVATGMLNKQIAYDLGTSEKTVKVHRARVMEKLRLGSVAELVRLVDRFTEVSAH